MQQQQQSDTFKMMAGGTRMGMVRCEHCSRQFNQHSAARHIPWCAKHQSELRRNKISPEKREALERFKWRINYKPTNRIANQSKARYQQTNSFNSKNNTFPNQSKNNNSLMSNASTASSTTSGRTNSIGSSDFLVTTPNINKRTNTNQRQIHNKTSSTQNTSSKQITLKRSVSSTTLTKQKSLASSSSTTLNGIRHDDSSGQQSTAFSRTKSSGDLQMSGRDIIVMSEVMELLAKRMDEIFEQNERLLHSLKITQKQQQQQQNSNFNTDDSVSNSNTILISSYDDEQATSNHCIHCETRVPHNEANYCHNCGYKLLNGNNSPENDYGEQQQQQQQQNDHEQQHQRPSSRSTMSSRD